MTKCSPFFDISLIFILSEINFVRIRVLRRDCVRDHNPRIFPGVVALLEMVVVALEMFAVVDVLEIVAVVD